MPHFLTLPRAFIVEDRRRFAYGRVCGWPWSGRRRRDQARPTSDKLIYMGYYDHMYQNFDAWRIAAKEKNET